MSKHLFSFWFSLAVLCLPFTVSAQESHSSCISSHFHQFHGPSDSVKVISIGRLQQWSTWCLHGYTAQKVEQAIRPCYDEVINTLRRQSDGYTNIGMKKVQEIKHQCRQQLWSEVIAPHEGSTL